MAVRATALVPQVRPMVIGRVLDLTGAWIGLVALLALAYQLTGDVRVVAALLLTQTIPRYIAAPIIADRLRDASAARTILLASSLGRVLGIPALTLVDSSSDLWWAGALFGVARLLMGIGEQARAAMLFAAVPRDRLGPLSAVESLVERLGFAIGALLAAVLISGIGVDGAFIAQAGLILTGLLISQTARVASQSDIVDLDSSASRPAVNSPMLAPQAAQARELRPIVAWTLVPATMAAVVMQVVLVMVVASSRSTPEAMLGVAFGAIGIGTLVGPLPIPRLLVRLHMPMLVAGFALAQAAIIGLVIGLDSLSLSLPFLLVVGVLAVTSDVLAGLMLRREVSPAHLPNAIAYLQRVSAISQVVILLAVIALAEQMDWSELTSALTIAIASVAIGLGVVRAGLERSPSGRLHSM